MRFMHRQSIWSHRIRRSHLLMAVPATVVLSLAAGCTRPQAAGSEKDGQATSSELAAVKVAHPQKKDVRRFIERPGYNIEAYERTPLYAKIAGYVLKWNFDIGDSVHKDDVLAELYIPEMDVELAQKKSAVRQAAAEIKQADATILRAQAELKRTKSQSERLDMIRRTGGTLSKEDAEEARLGFEV